MIINLTGVLDDGSPLSPGVPNNPRTTLNIPIGDNLTVRLRIVRNNGSVVKTGSVTMTLKKKVTDSRAIFSQTVNLNGQQDTEDLTMVPGTTKNQDPGLYVYDVWHTDLSGNRNPVVPLSPAVLVASATPPP